MKNVDGRAARLVDETDAALAGVQAEMAVTLTDIAAACREGLMAVADGTKVPVGLRLGDTENKTVVTALLADLVDRGQDATASDQLTSFSVTTTR